MVRFLMIIVVSACSISEIMSVVCFSTCINLQYFIVNNIKNNILNCPNNLSCYHLSVAGIECIHTYSRRTNGTIRKCGMNDT